MSKYPIDDYNTYLFPSRKSTGRKRENDNDIPDNKGNMPISESSICRLFKDTAKQAGIGQNIGNHSARKTFGYWVWHNAEDKGEALVRLQIFFNHSDTRTTAKYIGVTYDEISDMYSSINLGLQFI